MSTTFFKDVIRKPPVLFPIIGGFHVLALIYTLITFGSEPFPSIGWLQPLWILCYTIAWLFTCTFNKWGAYAYLLLTATNLILYLGMPAHRIDYVNSMFLMDVLFSFFILFYFKQFE